MTFRRDKAALGAVLFALVTGIGSLALYLSLAHVKINFLNFAALPVTFGIGVDYAINVAQRWVSNGKDAPLALRTSGGAVVLCSLTTMLGYVALLGSHNRGIRRASAPSPRWVSSRVSLRRVVALPALLTLLAASPEVLMVIPWRAAP